MRYVSFTHIRKKVIEKLHMDEDNSQIYLRDPAEALIWAPNEETTEFPAEFLCAQVKFTLSGLWKILFGT